MPASRAGRCVRRAPQRWPIAIVALFGPYYAWRFWYYGCLVPNTSYAKVGQTNEQILRGLAYVRSFLQLGVGWVLLVGAAGACGAGMWRRGFAVYVFLLAYVRSLDVTKLSAVIACGIARTAA